MATTTRTRMAWAAVLTLSLLAARVQAHEHHTDNIPVGEGISADPIDSILWLHIMVQIAAWGVIFPFGMVLGIIRSRWHVPVQVLGTCLAIVGYLLGHKHKGRQFATSAHASFAPYLGLLLFSQIVLGIYLKLHLERGILGRIRPWFVMTHGIIGKALPVAAWVQMLFGGITAVGFCRGDHLGQCLAHFIMGSAFIGYGIVLTLLLLVGQGWIRRTGRSQEFFDSIVIAAWGCVNTFTEHRWGGPWVKNDLQHTSMGIVWWCAGLVGIWLSRKRDGTPKRNIIPGIVIFMTGWAMSAHPQELMLSTMVHTAFGWTLMAAGASRIIEICFVLRDKPSVRADGLDPNSWQYLPCFLLYASGFLFMGATEEQMQLLSNAGVTHVSYILILFSISFLLFLFVNILLHIYAINAFPETAQAPSNPSHPRRHMATGSQESGVIDAENGYAKTNGHAKLNGHGHINGGMNGSAGMEDRERRRVRDAEEFELDALISDEEDDEGMEERKERL